MGLFSKREPCPICGGKVKGLLTWKVGGRPVCDECYGVTDLPDGALDSMSIEDFKGYMTFRKENEQLKQQFQVTQQVDFGMFDTKFVFDVPNRLLCMDKHLNKTIFQGSEIKSFTIKEDTTPLFEGTASGLKCYASAIPEQVRAMAPQIQQFFLQLQMQRELERLREKDKTSAPSIPSIHLPEPLQQFNVEIRFQHPYWKTFTADMKGPRFSSTRPDINDYLREYQKDIQTIETLARALAQVAFPDKPEQRMTSANGGGVVGSTVSSTTRSVPVTTGDPIEEIQRYKKLVEQGVLTEEEFAAKKRQLLGI